VIKAITQNRKLRTRTKSAEKWLTGYHIILPFIAIEQNLRLYILRKKWCVNYSHKYSHWDTCLHSCQQNYV